MKVGITGSNGFVAWHLRCYLYSLGDEIDEIRLAGRDTFSQHTALIEFVNGLDLIVHLAGVNRADDQELLEGNLGPARLLVDALELSGDSTTVVNASTTHALEPVTVYGEAKKGVSDLFSEWAARTQNRFINLVIPHVFGEYGRPYYNSGVATFCHQLTHGEKPNVNPHGWLELVHVQDLVEKMYTLYQEGFNGELRVEGRRVSVPEVVSRLETFVSQYFDLSQIPDLSDDIDRRLFNTLRSYIKYDDRNRSTELHADNRGWLVETVKAGSGGQCFVSSTHPGITRGNHFHRYKIERFFVLQGKATVKLRKLFSDEVISYQVDAQNPCYIDIPTLHTHNITNTGDSELITLFWADEFFDPENPDTFFEEVE